MVVTLVESLRSTLPYSIEAFPTLPFCNSCSAPAPQLSLNRALGIEMLETDTFKLHCFQTLTGTHFQTGQRHADGSIEEGIYQSWALVTKGVVVNPFWDKCTVICFVNLKPIFNLCCQFCPCSALVILCAG